MEDSDSTPTNVFPGLPGWDSLVHTVPKNLRHGALVQGDIEWIFLFIGVKRRKSPNYYHSHFPLPWMEKWALTVANTELLVLFRTKDNTQISQHGLRSGNKIKVKAIQEDFF
jgi:hypothetical protein